MEDAVEFKIPPKVYRSGMRKRLARDGLHLRQKPPHGAPIDVADAYGFSESAQASFETGDAIPLKFCPKADLPKRSKCTLKENRQDSGPPKEGDIFLTFLSELARQSSEFQDALLYLQESICVRSRKEAEDFPPLLERREELTPHDRRIKLKIGDPVFLIGDPSTLMTVVGISGRYVETAWMAGGILQQATLPLRVLV